MPGAEPNRIYAAILITGFALMVAGFIADGLVHRSLHTHAGAAVEDAGNAVVPGILPLLAHAKVADGQVAFARECGSCHTFTEGAGTLVGPDLWGIVGAPVARVASYPYSAALRALGGDWTYERLNRWLLDPQSVAPGTLMSYPGMPGIGSRADVIAFLRTLAKTPLPLPSAAQIAGAARPRQPLKHPRTDKSP